MQFQSILAVALAMMCTSVSVRPIFALPCRGDETAANVLFCDRRNWQELVLRGAVDARLAVVVHTRAIQERARALEILARSLATSSPVVEGGDVWARSCALELSEHGRHVAITNINIAIPQPSQPPEPHFNLSGKNVAPGERDCVPPRDDLWSERQYDSA